MLWLTLIVLLAGATPVVMAAACEPVVGRFASVEGRIEVQRAAGAAWLVAGVDTAVCARDTVRAGRHSRAALALVNDAVLRVDAGTTVRLVNVVADAEEPSFLELLRGAIQSFSRKPRLIKVNSPYINGTIEGTEFVLRVAQAGASLTVLEGRVRADNTHGSVLVDSGQVASAGAGQAPQLRTPVRPRDAVQWALYYPPLLALDGGTDRDRPDAFDDVPAALQALEAVPAGSRGARHQLERAALLLAVGAVDEAGVAIDEALRLDPGAGLALALRSIVHVVQNRTDEALADALRAVELAPAPSSRIALSYAQQARFDIDGARDTLLAAVAGEPRSALAWARLGELWLMLGERAKAAQAAERAAALAPGLARVRLVEGFIALAEYRQRDALETFAEAIAMRSADPIAHLGLGLARIGSGDLEAGRAELEIAVALDSNNALLRAYLGKAYFEERRTPLDSEQFGIAKVLDPLDPTPYLYDAIAKQTTNRPIEALHDLERSIELNDSRAVYRGRLLLDQDRAARGTSLARVYSDLGFGRAAIEESTKSLTEDPSNASAHRFLSDSYRGATRNEIARVSELLQSQMLQDVNINPIQPSIASTGLNIVTSGGPAQAGFNEFTPLFERNRAQINASGFAGSNGTHGAEAVVSGVFDNVSLSGGGFAFDTDGFRPNNDLRHRIADIYAQVALTPSLNVQAEYRHRDTEHGDLAFNFDPAQFSPGLRRSDVEDTQRVGLRYSVSPRASVLLSTVFGDRDRDGGDVRTLAPQGIVLGGTQVESFTRDDESEQYEGQFLYQGDRFNLVAGAAYARVTAVGTLTSVNNVTIQPPPIVIDCPIPIAPCPVPGFPLVLTPPPVPATATLTFPLLSSTDDYRSYAYLNYDVTDSLMLTGGLSYSDFEQELIDSARWSPKFGVQWQATENLRLRAAYTRVIKPVLASNRLLEPTQVAGFNQFFDDTDASRSERYGVAFDWRVNADLYAGSELSWRDVDHASVLLNLNRATFDERREELHRAYLYWTPTRRVALALEGVYDSFENAAPNQIFPRKVITRSFPLTATYFHPGGLFASATATYVSQKVVRQASTLAQGKSSFATVDLSVGYRLPKRHGVISLSVENLFDRAMRYQDDSFRSFGEESSGSPFVPERTVMGRFTLSY